MKKLNIGIVGGSLAGCSTAILLSRAGHSVQVFERSASRLVGRGGGIGTSGPVLQGLIEQDIVDADLPHLTFEKGPLIIRTPEHEALGYSPWQMTANFKTFNWSTLWGTLRKRVPDDSYHQGYEVVDAQSKDSESVTLRFKNGSTADFDLVIFADGYQSLGRKLLFPHSGLEYRGYMLWRGLLPEGEMENIAPLDNQSVRVAYTDLDGDAVFYFIPGLDGRTEKGQRIVNWAAYIPLPEAELSEFMVDRDGQSHSGSIPPGKIRLEEENRLKWLMRDNMPTYYADIVQRTKDTFVQLIYTSRLPAYRRGRIGLIGDAGMVAQPFTGSGIFKGYNNAKDLLSALNSYDTLEDCLAHWSKEQVRIGSRLLAYGEQMENSLIFRTFDLATADAESTAAWFKAAITLPEEFSVLVDEK